MGSIFCCRPFHLGHPQRVTQPQEWLIKHSILPPRSSSVVRTTRAPAPTPPVVQIAECSSTDTPKERTVKSLEALRTPPKASPRPPSHFSGNKSRCSGQFTVTPTGAGAVEVAMLFEVEVAEIPNIFRESFAAAAYGCPDGLAEAREKL